MGLGKIFKRVLPIVIGAATGGPIGATLAAVSSETAIKEQRKQQREQQRQQELANKFFNSRSNNMFIPSDISQGSTTARQQISSPPSGFGSSFGTFLSDVGSNIVNPLAGIFSQVRPMLTQQSRGQSAVPTGSTLGGQESQQSGTNQAFMGGFGNILGQAGRFLRTPAGSVGTGLAGGLVGNMFGGQQQGVRITRKMKSQFRSVLNLNMGNYELAADMVGVSVDFFIMVLLKRFRNDGPVVTKAALRKTKTTVRRLKSMCDMYDSLRPSATRRKTPMKRASTTLISNK